jgi:hypothetical protein
MNGLENSKAHLACTAPIPLRRGSGLHSEGCGDPKIDRLSQKRALLSKDGELYQIKQVDGKLPDSNMQTTANCIAVQSDLKKGVWDRYTSLELTDWFYRSAKVLKTHLNLMALEAEI